MKLTEKRINRFIAKNYKYKKYDFEIIGKEKLNGIECKRAKIKVEPLQDNLCFYVLIPEDVTKKIRLIQAN